MGRGGLPHLYPCTQSELHCAAQSRHRAHSPKCCSLCVAGIALLWSHPWGWLTSFFDQGQLYCIAWVRYRASWGSGLQRATSSKGQGQFYTDP